MRTHCSENQSWAKMEDSNGLDAVSRLRSPSPYTVLLAPLPALLLVINLDQSCCFLVCSQL